jgi:hypothetical protein
MPGKSPAVTAVVEVERLESGIAVQEFDMKPSLERANS